MDLAQTNLGDFQKNYGTIKNYIKTNCRQNEKGSAKPRKLRFVQVY